MARLGTLYQITSGGTPSRKFPEYYENGSISWVKTGDLKEKYLFDTEEKITQAGLDNSSAKIYPPDTVLLAMYGATIGATSILKIHAATNQACAAFIKRDDILPEYLYSFLQSQQSRFEKEAVGGAQPNISAGYLKQIEIPIPTFEKQTEIVEILGTVDVLIKKRKQQLSKLDELVKARFVEMFEDKEYPEIMFGDICEFLRNGANIKQEKDAGGFPITRIETLSNDIFNADRLGYADITDISKYEKYVLKKGDLLTSHINSIAYLGRTVQYREELISPVIHGMNLLCARLLEGYCPTYIEHFMKTKKAKDYISSITKKAVNQASITISDLKQMLVPIPPIECQNEFADFVEQTDKLKSQINQSLEKLETLKKALMQKYFG